MRWCNCNVETHYLIGSATYLGRPGSRDNRPKPVPVRSSFCTNLKQSFRLDLHEKGTVAKIYFNWRGLPGNTLSSCVADNAHYPPKFITPSKTSPCNYYHIMPLEQNTNTQIEAHKYPGTNIDTGRSKQDHTLITMEPSKIWEGEDDLIKH